jgi:hypothetical protein
MMWSLFRGELRRLLPPPMLLQAGACAGYISPLTVVNQKRAGRAGAFPAGVTITLLRLHTAVLASFRRVTVSNR